MADRVRFHFHAGRYDVASTMLKGAPPPPLGPTDVNLVRRRLLLRARRDRRPVSYTHLTLPTKRIV